MTSRELADKMVTILESKKGVDIQVIDVSEKTSIADYFVICSGNSTTQIKALANEVEFVLKNECGIVPNHVEGKISNRWILSDYGDVVLHVMHPDERADYDLERLWNTKKPL